MSVPRQPIASSDTPCDVATGACAHVTTDGDALRWHGPDPGWGILDLGELWRFRELGLVFTARDLKIRYRQAVVGIAWAVLQPLTTMLIFLVLFRLLGRDPTSPGIPYAVSAFCGLLPWQLFATSLRDGSMSLVTNRDLVTKVYFPRTLLPLATVMCGLVDLAIGSVVLALLMAWFHVVPGPQILALPLFLLLAVVLAFAGALWFAALNALYRDIGYIVPFLVQIGFLISPVMYETGSLIPSSWWLYGLNPMVAVIEGVRWSLLGTPMPTPVMMLLSFCVATALLVSGLFYFRRVETWIADRI